MLLRPYQTGLFLFSRRFKAKIFFFFNFLLLWDCSEVSNHCAVSRSVSCVKDRANSRNILGQQDATLLSPTCCERLHTMLCVVACCCDLLEVVGWSLKLVKLQSQQVPTFLLFRGHRSVVQQCCVRLHSTSNNVAPVHAHYMPRIHTNTCEQEIKMASEMENVPESFVFSSKDPTCCDLLRAFAHIGYHRATRDNIFGPNNDSCCCKRLHGPLHCHHTVILYRLFFFVWDAFNLLTWIDFWLYREWCLIN